MLPVFPLGSVVGGRGITPRLRILLFLFPFLSGFSSSSSFGASVGEARLSLVDRGGDFSLPVLGSWSAC